MIDPIIQHLQTPNALGLLLAAQLGTTPSEIIAVTRTVTMNPENGQLTPVGMYQIKLGSLIEHKITLGAFNHAALLDDHPILYHHNHQVIRVFVTSKADDPDDVFEQLATAYLDTFTEYRKLADDLNQRTEPDDILRNGMGTLGDFPEPFAITVARLLHENGVKTTLVATDPKIGGFRLLAFDDSYFVARTIEVQEIS